jgi:hypothetical protein
MEYTTPPSYGSTVVSVGGIATDGKILFANAMPPVSHDETAPDSDNAWPEPKAVTWKWEGTTADGQAASAVLSGSLGPRTDRVDVMGEMPKFVKNIVAGASGTKPYIYQVRFERHTLDHYITDFALQYAPKMTIKVTINGETKEEEGRLFSEATFIS